VNLRDPFPHRSNTLEALVVVAPLGYRDEELLEPKSRLEEAGVTVTVASTRRGECRGMLGGRIEATVALDEVVDRSFDLVVVVGGIGSSEHLWQDETLQRIVRDQHDHGRTVAAICLSSVVLAKAGILAGRRATVWPEPAALDAFAAHGVQYERELVVVSGNVVTGAGPHAATAFASALVEALSAVIVGA